MVTSAPSPGVTRDAPLRASPRTRWDGAPLSMSSVTQSCPTLCDPMDCSTPGLPVHHQLPEFTQTHVHWVGDAIQPSHPAVPFSHLQSFPASGSFPMSQLFASGSQSIVSANTIVILAENWQWSIYLWESARPFQLQHNHHSGGTWFDQTEGLLKQGSSTTVGGHRKPNRGAFAWGGGWVGLSLVGHLSMPSPCLPIHITGVYPLTSQGSGRKEQVALHGHPAQSTEHTAVFS